MFAYKKKIENSFDFFYGKIFVLGDFYIYIKSKKMIILFLSFEMNQFLVKVKLSMAIFQM